jgi:hypothetical protein
VDYNASHARGKGPRYPQSPNRPPDCSSFA